MLFWIFAGLAVFLANIYLPAGLYFFSAETIASHVGPRDDDPPPNRYVARARRSLANHMENLPFFLTFAILALVLDGVDMPRAILGAQIFVLARAAFMLLYVLGTPWLRSVAYLTGAAGCILMALALV